METVRKTKTATEPEIDETLNVDLAEEGDVTTVAEVKLEAPQTPLLQEPKKSLLNEAPELYGNNPTAEQIERFRQDELVWRRKLSSI